MIGRTSLALACAAALSGCSFSSDIARHAVEYNRTIEQAENEVMLLNILRASKGRPMYFSRLVVVDGRLKASAGLNATLTGGREGTVTSSGEAGVLSLNGETNPSFQVKPLDSKEFFSGFIQPLSASVYDSYLSAGYQPEMLLPMLVEGAVLTDRTGEEEIRCKIFRNLDNPGRSTQAYAAFVDALAKIRLPLSGASPAVKAPRLSVKVATADDLAALGKLPLKDYSVDIAGGGKVAVGPARINRRVTAPAIPPKGVKTPPGKVCSEVEIGGISSWFKRTEEERAKALEDDRALRLDIEFSSAQGVFFALGELLRARRNGDVPSQFGGFKVSSGGAPPTGAISTLFDGETYWIAPEDERSYGYIALARQLFSLNISSEQEAAFAGTRLTLQ